MAACKITNGIDAPACADKFSVPGIQVDNIYIGNFSEVSSFTESVDGEISAITFDQYKGVKQLVVHEGTVSWMEELVTGENSGSHYNQTFTFRTINTDTATRNAIEDMVDVPAILLAKNKKGEWHLLGESAGIRVSENTKGTGAVSGDDTGDLVTFTGENLGKIKKFLDTDDATTQTTVEGYVV